MNGSALRYSPTVMLVLRFTRQRQKMHPVTAQPGSPARRWLATGVPTQNDSCADTRASDLPVGREEQRVRRDSRLLAEPQDLAAQRLRHDARVVESALQRPRGCVPRRSTGSLRAGGSDARRPTQYAVSSARGCHAVRQALSFDEFTKRCHRRQSPRGAPMARR